MIEAILITSPPLHSRALKGIIISLLSGVFSLFAILPAQGETNLNTSTNQASRNVRAEEIRNVCIQGRRHICGRVLQTLPNGLVVDSGYESLLAPPFNHSWVVHADVSPARDPSLVEEKKPDAIAVGLVFLTNIPKRPGVKLYDYVVIRGYPTGEQLYTPVPGVQKSLRRFSASLERAVQTNLLALPQ